MNHAEFDVTCLCCGGSLVTVNGAHPSQFEALLVLRCDPCRREFTVSVHMRAEPGRFAGRRRLTSGGVLVRAKEAV